MTEPVAMNTCSSHKTLRAFMDGRMDVTAQQRVIEHMTECVACRNVVLAANDSSAVQGVTRARVRAFPRRMMLFAALLATVAVLVVAFGPMFVEKWDSHRAMGELVDVSHELSTRPLEARLTGGFAYKDAYRIMRGDGKDDRSPAKGALHGVQINLFLRNQHDRTVETLHALAKASLYERKIDVAIDLLRAALRTETDEDDIVAATRNSHDAALLTDFSAALSGDETDGSPSRRYALEAAVRAWALEQTPETAWNRALAMERMEQKRAAMTAWNDYLRLDPSSPWAAEARTRLKGLHGSSPSGSWSDTEPRFENALREADQAAVASIARAFPMQARGRGEDEELSCWANAALAGNVPAAQRCLDRAGMIGEALRANSGECLLLDTVRFIERSARATLLAQAHARYAHGRRAYKANQFQEAGPHFQEAQRLFAASRSPFGVMARLYAANVRSYTQDYAGALKDIRQLLAEYPDRARYRSAYGLACWVSGSARASLGRLSEAREDYEIALGVFSATRETDLSMSMSEMLANVYDLAGNRDDAWRVRRESLRELDQLGGDALRAAQGFGSAARAATREGLIATARFFNDQSIASTSNPVLKAEAYSRSAVLSLDDGDPGSAARYTALAARTAQGIRDLSMREFITSAPEYVRGRCADVEPGQCAEAIRDAIRRNGEHEKLRAVELQLLLSKELLQTGDIARATAALDEAVQIIDEQQRTMTDPQWSDALLDERRGVYRALTSVLAGAGRTDEALLQAERCRARSVSAAFGAAVDVRTTADLARLRAAIPANTSVVFYVLTDERLLTWVLSSTQSQLFTVRPPPDAAETLTRLETTRANDEFVSAVQEASAWLVDPWISSLPASTDAIVFIPDDRLANVPFTALRSGETWLIDRFTPSTAPSLAMYAACVERDRQLRGGEGNLLVVAAADARPELHLEYLPNVMRELAGFRRRSDVTILENQAASRSGFLEAASRASRIHFTTHGIVNQMRPSFSALVLQRGADDDGLLYVHQIAKLRLPHTRMVMIAACGASRAGRSGREGTATIGRAFMAAGVPVVISSTRDIDDAIAAVIVESFYRRVDAGADPATALRETQLSLKRSVAPVDWASMQVMGGIAYRERGKWLAN
jgi:CHAT domain-containing protein/tetratricopeptide (TPR) repeat protein